MELQFYKKTEQTASLDTITTYYVMSDKQSTLLMMNTNPPVRYIITCLPAPVEITNQMQPIEQNEYLEAATKSNTAVYWYVDEVNMVLK
jgi:hypothetical protein